MRLIDAGKKNTEKLLDIGYIVSVQSVADAQPTVKDTDSKMALNMAIAALKKQIAKEPIDRCMFKECPTCHNVEIEHCNYCPDCGQKLDWGEQDTEKGGFKANNYDAIKKEVINLLKCYRGDEDAHMYPFGFEEYMEKIIAMFD